MARSCGIRIGPRRFELVVLDGSAKKHRITAFKASEFPRSGEDPIGAAIGALKEAVKSHKVPTDNVSVAIDTGLAAFRNLKLPFSDLSKVEDVIKFEIEGDLPQWSIDDVVCDFMVLQGASGPRVPEPSAGDRDPKRRRGSRDRPLRPRGSRAARDGARSDGHGQRRSLG